MCCKSWRNKSNNKQSEFIFDNISIQNNVINSAYKNGVKNLIFLGSSCVYPRNCDKRIKEKYLLNEKTNEPYAIAKIAELSFAKHIIISTTSIINV